MLHSPTRRPRQSMPSATFSGASFSSIIAVHEYQRADLDSPCHRQLFLER